ncbi:hypothetical protein AALO_G00071850 [Alosa alosa]|uniref:Uncharacterized protein n=1 Tax=Alosa alosa TaxID=278164 RepID=A0AAV6H5Y1_9TELE|nr:hypothetical protein AALO_G00071850 [Alosa alosa]
MQPPSSPCIFSSSPTPPPSLCPSPFPSRALTLLFSSFTTSPSSLAPWGLRMTPPTTRTPRTPRTQHALPWLPRDSPRSGASLCRSLHF